MENPHILVVDDNHINRLFFESALNKLNCTVTSAEDGYEAIKYCKTHSFDLILMDIRMNGINGIETAQKIHQIALNSNTSIVAISAEVFHADEHVDFVDSLLKPIKQDALSTIIAHYAKPKVVFNHHKALSISHGDENIVKHLRDMFLKQLPELKTTINYLYNQKDFQRLDHELHQFLGSVKVCAAEVLATKIEVFKNDLSTECLDELNKSIDEILTLTSLK